MGKRKSNSKSGGGSGGIIGGIFVVLLLVGCMANAVSPSSQSSNDKPQTNHVVNLSYKDENKTQNDKNNKDNDKSATSYTYPSATLRSGSNGDEVKWLQNALNKAMGTGLTVDGDYGKNTYDAVINFQARCGLTADGVAGEKTVSMLNDIISGKKKLPSEPKTKPSPSVAPSVAQEKYAEQPVVQQNNNGQMVWIPTNGGTKYHSKKGCSKMIDPEYVSLEEAKFFHFIYSYILY